MMMIDQRSGVASRGVGLKARRTRAQIVASVALKAASSDGAVITGPSVGGVSAHSFDGIFDQNAYAESANIKSNHNYKRIKLRTYGIFISNIQHKLAGIQTKR